MKKAVVLFTMLLAALALAACGGGGSSSSSTAEEPSATAESESEAGGEAKSEGGGAEAEGGTAGSGSEVAIEANPEGQLAFEQKEVTAKAGKDTIDFTNQSAVPHNVTIENSAGETIGETETLAEGSASATVNLKPGTYTFFCSVPGHRQAGMEGKLVV
ncbi:MAG TPA: plastocyanin/azurin family copper-binding protein, partial [Solirubrobacterales bacterium]